MKKSAATAAAAVLFAACTSASNPTSPTSPTVDRAVGETTLPASLSSSAAPATSVPASPEHRIGVRVVHGEGEFFDRTTGEEFVIRGVNYVFFEPEPGRWSNEPFNTFDYDPEQTRADFRRLTAAGFNTVRMFLDHCRNGRGCIATPDRPGLNPEYLANIVDVLDAAAEVGLFLLLTSNDIPDRGGYGSRANRSADDRMAGYRNAHYLTAAGHEAAAAYWGDLLDGLADRGARFDHVLAWSLLNEQWLFRLEPPLSLAAGAVTTADGITYDMATDADKRTMVANNLNLYVETVVAAIKHHDPTALVTMGFFAPQFPNATEIGGDWYVDTVSYIEGGAALDFYDFHTYPGEDIPLAQVAENFGVHLLPHKPVVMGEYGAFIHRFGELTTAARAVSEWLVESCALGFDGWIYWSYRTNPEASDKTWGLTSEGDFLLEALAPAARPDPCAPIAVQTDNLAFAATVTASRFLEAEPPELAVDENETTQWGAGAGPVQWIEIDLGDGTVVSRIRLLVAQFPEGETVHLVRVDRGAGLETVHELSGLTHDGDWLVFEPETALTGVRRIRIETVVSPSWVGWREIEVKGS